MSYKIIAVVGPTAVGKSDVGVRLAQLFDGEIINGDSIQVYRELNIGSAKITEEEMGGIVHHLLDYKNVGDEALETHYTAVTGLEGLAVLAVHRTESDM